MEAIILAGGLGTRLQKVVSDVPKPMADVAGKPFLEILINGLEAQGFSRIILSVGYMASKISSHFGPRFKGAELIYIVEDRPLGTGGAARLAIEACLSDHVFIFNGDTYIDLDVRQLEKRWQKSKCPMLVAKWVPDNTRYGELRLSGDQAVSLEPHRAGGPALVNAGCYVLPVGALKTFHLGSRFSIETGYLAPEIDRSKVEVFVTDGLFIDIGIPEDYVAAQTLVPQAANNCS